MDEADDVDFAVTVRPGQFQEPHAAINDRPVYADRPRCEVRPPTWMRDCILISKRHLLNHAYDRKTVV